MYTYIRSQSDLWTVGTGTPGEDWCPESDHDSLEDAKIHAAKLNNPEIFAILRGLTREITELKDRLYRLENSEDSSEYDQRPVHLKPVRN